MITLHAIGRIFASGIGETKDLWVQWGLEEMGLDYQVRAWDHTAGETRSAEFAALSPFNQIPVVEHDGVVIAESGAILIHLAETSGRLIPTDTAGRARVIQWCFAAMSTVHWPLSSIAMVDEGLMGQDDKTRPFLVDLADRWLEALERQLAGRTWIAGDDFTIADVLMAGVLREVRHHHVLEGYAGVGAYLARALDRPAWHRALALYAQRLGVTAESIG